MFQIALIWPDIPETRRKAYSLTEIRQWLALFLTRFFANQFKRSALPNGPKISSGGSLSPRGDWRAPSEGTGALHLMPMPLSGLPTSIMYLPPSKGSRVQMYRFAMIVTPV